MKPVSSKDIQSLSEIYSNINSQNNQTTLNEQQNNNPFAQAAGSVVTHALGSIVQPPIQYVRGITGQEPPKSGGIGINPVSQTTYRAGKTALADTKKTVKWLQQFGVGAQKTMEGPPAQFCRDAKGELQKCDVELYGDLINEHLDLIFEKKQVRIVKSGGVLSTIEVGPDGKPIKGVKPQAIDPGSSQYDAAAAQYDKFRSPQQRKEDEKKLEQVRKKAAEDAKRQGPKAEPPKAEEPKVEPPKAEEPKVEPPKAEEPKEVLAKKEGETGTVKVVGGKAVEGSFVKKDWQSGEKERYETLRGAEQLKKDEEIVAKVKAEREKSQQQNSEKPEEKKEEYDAFDNIRDYLVCGGYAQDVNEATSIMVNMNNDWKNHILELFNE